MTATFTIPPDLPPTIQIDSEENIKKTCADIENRLYLEDWFLKTDISLSWVKEHFSYSLKLLKIITKASIPQEFDKVDKICSIFRICLQLKDADGTELAEFANAFVDKFFKEDRAGFEQYLYTTGMHGWTSFHRAVAQNNMYLIQFIHKNLPVHFEKLLHIQTQDKKTPLFLAIFYQNLDFIKFISREKNVFFHRFLESTNGIWERNPVLEASALGFEEFLRYLYENFNELFIRLATQTSKSGLTCLHWASVKNYFSICSLIQTIDPEIFNRLLKIKDETGCTPLHYAVLNLNRAFVKKISVIQPAFYEDFLNKSEPDVFRKLFLSHKDSKSRFLLSLMIEDNEFELFEIVRKKEPHLFGEYLKQEECAEYPHPLRVAFEKERIPFLDLMNNHYPDVFDKLQDISFVNSLIAKLGKKASMLLGYSKQYPVTEAYLATYLLIINGNGIVAKEQIKAVLALPFAKQYVEAILQCNSIIIFLNKNEDILTEWLDAQMDLDFMSWDSGMDILVQLPPREVKNTMDNMSNTLIEQIRDTTTYVQGDLDIDGSTQSYWWILQTIHTNYHPNLGDEWFFSIAREQLLFIPPQGFAAMCLNNETEQMVKDLLLAIPEPHYRAVIPLLTEEEFITFLDNLSLPEKIPYLRVATAAQKCAFLQDLTLGCDDCFLWEVELKIILDELHRIITGRPLDNNVAKEKFQKLTQTWLNGQKHLTFTSNQELALIKLKKFLILYDKSDELNALVSTRLDRYIKILTEFSKDITISRNTIWEGFAKNPILQSEPIPEEFICPISGDIMKNPMEDKYGQNYEEELIVNWVRERGTSPMTRMPLTLKDLTLNAALKKRIGEFKKK